MFPEGEWFTGSSLKGRFVRTHGRRWLLRWGGSLVFTIGGGDYRVGCSLVEVTSSLWEWLLRWSCLITLGWFTGSLFTIGEGFSLRRGGSPALCLAHGRRRGRREEGRLVRGNQREDPNIPRTIRGDKHSAGSPIGLRNPPKIKVFLK